MSDHDDDDDWRVTLALLRQDVRDLMRWRDELVKDMKERSSRWSAARLAFFGGLFSLIIATVIGAMLSYWLSKR